MPQFRRRRSARTAHDIQRRLPSEDAFGLVVYLGFSWEVRQLSGETASIQKVARTFVFSLIPIALAYNMAHFISLLAIQGQFIISFASGPFGQGWDLLGTADHRINLTVINAKIVW